MTHMQSGRPRTASKGIGMKVANHKAARSGPDRRTQSAYVPHRIATRGQPVLKKRGEEIAVVGQIDSKNRLSLPRSVRDAIHVGPGDAVFLNVDTTTGDVPTVRVVKAVNPLAIMLDALAEEAMREYYAGETVSLRDIAAQYGVDLDSPETDDDGQ